VRSILIVLLLASLGNAAEVVVTRLDGRTISGTLQGWDDKQVVLETTTGQQTLAADELLSLKRRVTAAATSSEPRLAGVVELIDGTMLPIDDLECRGSKVIVKPHRATPSPANREVLTKKVVAAVRLQPLEAEAAKQWQEIRDLEAAADILVVAKRDGKSLDYVECVLGDVTGDKISIELDGDEQQVDRKKVAGFIYYRRKSDSPTEVRFAVKGDSGLQANATAARMIGDKIQLTTASGAEVEWPLDDIYLADFSAGKLLYLSDMAPASQEWTPLVGLPAAAAVSAKYGEPRRDQSAYGGSLTIVAGEASAGSSTGAVQTYAKGLAIRSHTELVYRLSGELRRFQAVAGIDPASRTSGNVRLEIFGDDRPLLQTDVAGTKSPQEIDLDVAGIKRLKIVVDYGENLDTGDWLNLCDARLVK
jgi:NPCBM/NEW2 domain-containing protein